MSPAARVESIDILREFRAALCKFTAAARAALDEADFEIQRKVDWLKMEQQPFWKAELRKRQERFQQAQVVLRNKKTYLKGPLDSNPSLIDERKALAAAQRRLEEAQQKSEAVRRWIPTLEKEAISYRGISQRLGQATEVDLPNARALLDRMLEALEAYLAVAPADAGGEQKMTRPVEEIIRETIGIKSIESRGAGQESAEEEGRK